MTKKSFIAAFWLLAITLAANNIPLKKDISMSGRKDIACETGTEKYIHLGKIVTLEKSGEYAAIEQPEQVYDTIEEKRVPASQKTLKERPRVYILTDISSIKAGTGEPDDTQSLIRFLLYANEFDIEGIGVTYTSHGDTIYPQYVDSVLMAYKQSVEKLRKHGNYPLAEELTGRIKCGNPHKGTQYIGKDYQTELSDDLVRVLQLTDRRPLWVLVWGGSLDLAQALWQIKSSLPADHVNNLVDKLRVYSIGDQYDSSGSWIRNNFKQLFFILNNGSFRGMYRTGNTALTSSEWVKKNILSSPAPLARMYPDYAGKDPWGTVHGIKEGDTPSFLYLLPQSPNKWDNPEINGWGGNFYPIKGTKHFIDGKVSDTQVNALSIAKWRADFQCDFLKRINWLK